MARRPNTSSEEGSSQPVDERPVKVKKEKIRRATAEDEEMEERGGITVADGPGDDDEDDDDNDGPDNGPSQGPGDQSSDEEEKDSEGGGSARTAKRQRTSTGGVFVENERHKRRPKMALVRDKDG